MSRVRAALVCLVVAVGGCDLLSLSGISDGPPPSDDSADAAFEASRPGTRDAADPIDVDARSDAGRGADASVVTDSAPPADSNRPVASEAGSGDASHDSGQESGTTLASGYAAVVLADKPVAYYRLDEAPGTTTVNDTSGSGLNGVFVGPDISPAQPGLIANDPDTAMVTSPSTPMVFSYVDVGYQQALALSQFTIEAWVRPTNSGPGSILGFGEGYQMHANEYGSGTYDVVVYGCYLPSTRTTVVPGQRVYLAAVYSPPTFELYINDLPPDSSPDLAPDGSGCQPVYNPGYPFAIGADRSTTDLPTFAGTIDEVAIYDHALSSTQIRRHYAVGAGIDAGM
jgi:hypothetical protein